MHPSTATDVDDFPPKFASPTALSSRRPPIRLEYPPIDVRLLSEQCLGNLAFGVSLLEKFQATAGERMTKLREQAAQRDFRAVSELAHSFKGVVGILGAEPLLDLTTSLQDAAESADADEVDHLVKQIEYEMRRLLEEIPKLRSIV